MPLAFTQEDFLVLLLLEDEAGVRGRARLGGPWPDSPPTPCRQTEKKVKTLPSVLRGR